MIVQQQSNRLYAKRQAKRARVFLTRLSFVLSDKTKQDMIDFIFLILVVNVQIYVMTIMSLDSFMLRARPVTFWGRFFF